MLKKAIKIITNIILIAGISMFLLANVSKAEGLQEETMVKINKTNFPGFYQVLKEKAYDINKDGYLSTSECNVIGSFTIKKEVSSL